MLLPPSLAPSPAAAADLTLPPERKPKLRGSVPGQSYYGMGEPGLRWNVVDYGAHNVFADPLSRGERCNGERSAWHCIWQRFPQQRWGAASPMSPFP